MNYPNEMTISGKKYVKTTPSAYYFRCKEIGEQNEQVMKSPAFQTACSNVGIPATRRQASKFRRKMGKAYKEGRK
jgi:hypothetical protein